MAEVASAYVSILPSAKGFGSKLDSQISGDIDSSGKRAGSKWGASLKAAAAGGVAALGVIVVKTLSDSVTAASEAQQAVGGVEAVFGKYAKSVLADSKKAATGLGLSAAAYNELITVSGAMLKNKGIKDFAGESKKLITVGADLAAMFGGSTTQAVEALNSAMRGESDPIEKYGIALNAASIEAEAVSLGLVKNVKNLDTIKAAQNTAVLAQRKYTAALKEGGKGSDEALASESSLIRAKAALSKALDGQKVQLTGAQKATASLSLVQKQSADATGAFSRESNTLAGQQQRLSAKFDNIKVTIGTALLPALTDLAVFVSDDLLPALSRVAKVVLPALGAAFKTLGRVGTALWNNALQPAFKFIINGVASILDMWSSMLSVLGKVPGFGWAKDAAEAMGNAADKARDLADGIKKIPNKKVTVTVAYQYKGLRSTTRSGNSNVDSSSLLPDILPRATGIPSRKSFLQYINKNYGDAGTRLLTVIEKGIKAATPKTVKAAQDAFTKIQDKLTSTRDTLKGTLDGLKDDFASLAESVSSAFTGDLFNVSSEGKSASFSFIENLMGKKAELSGLLASFTTLKGWGLDPAFLSQLFASGNGALITELAGMGQAGATSAANLFGEVQSLGNQLGSAVASNDPVAGRIDETNKQLGEVNRQLSFLADDIGAKLNDAAAKGQRTKKNRGSK